MSNTAKSLVDWLKSNAMQVILLLGMCGNFYLTSKFATRSELQTHIEAESKVHESITISLAKQEALLDVVKGNNQTTILNQIKLAEHDSRISAVEKQVDKLSK